MDENNIGRSPLPLTIPTACHLPPSPLTNIKINLSKNHYAKINDDKAIISCINVKIWTFWSQ